VKFLVFPLMKARHGSGGSAVNPVHCCQPYIVQPPAEVVREYAWDSRYSIRLGGAALDCAPPCR